MSLRALEALVLFLATHGRVWKAHCASMGVSGDAIAKELTRQHARKLTREDPRAGKRRD